MGKTEPNRREPFPPETASELASAKLEAYVAKVVAESPPLTPEQLDLISAALHGGADAGISAEKGRPAGKPGGDAQQPPPEGRVPEIGTFEVSREATDTEPGCEVVIDMVDGRPAATKIVLSAPNGRGITRSMLHGMDIHGIVQQAVRDADASAEQLGLLSSPSLMKETIGRIRDGALTGDDRLHAVASVYRLAKRQGVPLHQIAADLGVHKKTLQRWAQQAEKSGFLSSEDRVW